MKKSALRAPLLQPLAPRKTKIMCITLHCARDGRVSDLASAGSRK
jgi:hypothetical protein